MKKKWSHWVSGVMAFTLAAGLLSGAPPAKAENQQGSLLANSSFEDVQADGTVNGWSPDGKASVVETSNTVYVSGKRSLMVKDQSASESFGAISDPVTAAPFTNVVLNVKVRPETGSGGKIDLRFYNTQGQLLSVVSGLVNGTSGEWTDLRVAAAAPKDSAQVKAAFYYPNESQGTMYVDDARLSTWLAPGTITNLGPQSTSLTIMTGAYGKDKDGRDVMFTVAQGDPAQFIVTDVKTKEIKDQHPLVALDGSNVSAAWAIAVATDGKVYVGSTPNGTLFQYDPLTQKVRTLGKPVPSDTIVLVLVPGPDGKVYGGTGYSQSLFEYDPATDKSRVLTSFKSGPKEDHVRALAYDPERQVLYAGLSDVAKLYKYDLTTGAKTQISHPGFEGKVSVYDLQFTAGKLFIRLNAGPVMYVYDPATNTWPVENNTQYNTRGFSPVSPDNRVFYTYYETMPDGKSQWSLHAYDVTTDTYKSLGVDVKGAGIAFGYVNLERPDFPGVSLVGLAGNSGWSFYYNLETGKLETAELPLPPQYVELFNIGKGVDGQMLSSGFISGGGMGIYSPSLNETKLYPQLGQIEGYATLNGLNYFGGYPGASIFVHDPVKPWNRTDNSLPLNPNRLTQLGQEQERPVAMLGVEEYNKLFIGSYPLAGKIGGALTIYDPVTGSFDVKRNIIPDHSINTLAYRDGKLYMGTGAMNGGSGKLAVYDIASGQIEYERVPVEGKKAVASFVWGPDGNLWGMALGELFIFDPVTRKVIYSDDKFPGADYVYANPRLMVGTDQNVYGSIFTGLVGDKTYVSKLFKIDAESKAVQTLLESNVEKLAQDDFGNFYFKYGSELMKYSDPNLVVKLSKVELRTDKTRLKWGEQVPFSYKALLEKGRATNELSGASVEFRSSRPEVAVLGQDGQLLALHPGKTEVSVRITLNGVTVESEKVEIQVTGPKQ